MIHKLKVLLFLSFSIVLSNSIVKMKKSNLKSNWIQTCDQGTVTNGVLTTKCATNVSSAHTSSTSVDLNTVIANMNGQLVIYSGFAQSCINCTITVDGQLACQCQRAADEVYVSSQIPLNPVFSNINGVLELS